LTAGGNAGEKRGSKTARPGMMAAEFKILGLLADRNQREAEQRDNRGDQAGPCQHAATAPRDGTNRHPVSLHVRAGHFKREGKKYIARQVLNNTMTRRLPAISSKALERAHGAACLDGGFRRLAALFESCGRPSYHWPERGRPM